MEIQLSVTQGIMPQPFDVVANNTVTYNIDNPLSASSYFVLETVRNDQGYYDENSPKNTQGGAFSIMEGNENLINNMVQNDYFTGFVIPPGNYQIFFNPINDITGSTLLLRGMSSNEEIYIPIVPTYTGTILVNSEYETFPVSDFLITLDGPEFIEGDINQNYFSDVPEGIYQIEVNAPYFQPNTTPLNINSAFFLPVVLETSMVGINFTVLDANTNDPINDAVINLYGNNFYFGSPGQTYFDIKYDYYSADISADGYETISPSIDPTESENFVFYLTPTP
jgi:hypothetical protein